MIEKSLRYFEVERQLSFHQQGSKLALDMMRDGALSVDRYGMIHHINPTCAGLLGRKREDIIGKHVAEIFSAPKSWSLNFHELDLKLKDPLGNDMIARFKRISDPYGNALGAVGSFQPHQDAKTSPLWVGTRSPKSAFVLERAQRAALTQSSVLIQGESGTGKEIIARMIHELSPRRNGPFVALNCAALPLTLLESELFGYADGAFTGARRGGQPGKFELANHGTIFLDEIGDMPLSAQVALLRLLQEKEITRIGDKKPQKLDVRVLTATHKNLKTLVDAQQFRLDLYFRLKVVTIDLPPLRERLEDLPELVPHLIRKSCVNMGQPYMGIQEEVYAYFYAHHWPGNVRELENCLEGMMALSNAQELTVNDLPEELKAADLAETPFTDLTTPSAEESSPPLLNEPLLLQQTRQTIIQALAQTQGKISPAAKILGIGRNTLYRKMKELNINR